MQPSLQSLRTLLALRPYGVTELALKQDATDANLQTTDTTIVGAINELNSGKQDATDSNLQTTDQTVVGAINELKNDIVTSNYWKSEKLTIANGVAVNAGVETAPVTVSVPEYTGYTVLTFTEVRATGYHGAKITVQAELANANELVYALYNPSNVNATVTVTVRLIYVKTIT